MSRRELTTEQITARIAILQIDPQFHRGNLEGLAQIEAGEFITYDEFRTALQNQLSALSAK